MDIYNSVYGHTYDFELAMRINTQCYCQYFNGYKLLNSIHIK